jgi:murein DD-endopeptidase MepM/ murein hydrolase activator NlpD
MRAREFLKEEPVMSLVKKVAAANGISNPNLIKVGQQLTLPDGKTYTVAPGDTLSAIVTGQFKGKPPVAGTVKTGPNPNIDDPTRQRAQASVSNLPGPGPDTKQPNAVPGGWTDSNGNPITSSDGTQVGSGSTPPKPNKPAPSKPAPTQDKPTDSSEIKPVNGSISSPFGNRTNPITGQPQSHAGVDIPVVKGTPIKAPVSGKVTQATPESPGCGGTIAISNGKIQHRFCHCSKVDVQVGQEVAQGEIVGLTGGKKGDPGAGASTGPHLHWEKKDLASGKLMNPVALA